MYHIPVVLCSAPPIHPLSVAVGVNRNSTFHLILLASSFSPVLSLPLEPNNLIHEQQCRRRETSFDEHLHPETRACIVKVIAKGG